MNRKAILRLTSICIVAFALVVLVFHLKQEGVDEKFTVGLEPNEIGLRVGEFRNLTINIVSTGYEGGVTVSDPTYSFIGQGNQTALEYQIIPSSDEPNARFIESDGELTLTLRIRWMGNLGMLYLSIAAYGNYQKDDEFRVLSNSVTITIMLPY